MHYCDDIQSCCTFLRFYAAGTPGRRVVLSEPGHRVIEGYSACKSVSPAELSLAALVTVPSDPIIGNGLQTN